jgi:hypothetical protein
VHCSDEKRRRNGDERRGRNGDERRKKMLTSGAHMSLRGEHKYNNMYIFIYACSWARVVFVCISWHI